MLKKTSTQDDESEGCSCIPSYRLLKTESQGTRNMAAHPLACLEYSAHYYSQLGQPCGQRGFEDDMPPTWGLCKCDAFRNDVVVRS